MDADIEASTFGLVPEYVLIASVEGVGGPDEQVDSGCDRISDARASQPIRAKADHTERRHVLTVQMRPDICN
jgi:hypothetical protein